MSEKTWIPKARYEQISPAEVANPVDDAALHTVALASAFPKRCGCGKVYDFAAWSHLALCGLQSNGDEALELRQCACHSCIAVPCAVFKEV